MNDVDGFEIPVHKSLTEPILLAGVPRRIAIINGAMMAAFGFGGQSLLAIPIGLAFHVLFAALTRIDPNFFDVLFRNLKRKAKWSV